MLALKTKTLTIATILLLTVGSSAHASADNVGANARLAFSDKLSMYSQRIIGSACALTSENSPFESRGYLAVAAHEVNRILNALEKGDRALGIPSPEENERILKLITVMKAEWLFAEDIVQKVLSGSADPQILRTLEARKEEFLDFSLRLVDAVSNQYMGEDALHLTDAVRLQVAGRQRMLSQKISHMACTIQKTGNQAARDGLSETFRLFEVSAKALRDGMPEVGLKPTKDPVLIASLDEVTLLWNELKWPLTALERGATWDRQTQEDMYLKLNQLMHKMDKVVVAYTKAAQISG